MVAAKLVTSVPALEPTQWKERNDLDKLFPGPGCATDNHALPAPTTASPPPPPWVYSAVTSGPQGRGGRLGRQDGVKPALWLLFPTRPEDQGHSFCYAKCITQPVSQLVQSNFK